jgi:aarF domain-containing kinase
VSLLYISVLYANSYCFIESSDFISDHLRAELDFVEEAWNASIMTELVSKEPSLTGRVHIPKVYPEYSTKKVMTAEWIDGVRLSDREAIKRLMGEGRGGDSAKINGTGGRFEEVNLKGGVKAIMQTMVNLFSAQMFQMGWIHCDPHPGKLKASRHRR